MAGAGSPPQVQNEEEALRKNIEDLRAEVRELRNMVNILMEMIVNMETREDLEPEMEPTMMGYDNVLKNGRYCM